MLLSENYSVPYMRNHLFVKMCPYDSRAVQGSLLLILVVWDEGVGWWSVWPRGATAHLSPSNGPAPRGLPALL